MSKKPPPLSRDEAEFEGELTALRLRLAGGDPGEFGLPGGSPLPAALAAMLARPARRAQLYRLWLRKARKAREA